MDTALLVSDSIWMDTVLVLVSESIWFLEFFGPQFREVGVNPNSGTMERTCTGNEQSSRGGVKLGLV